MPTHTYKIWAMSQTGDVELAGAFALNEADNHKVRSVIFKYAASCEISLDPRHTKTSEALTFSSDGRSLPGFIDDCLPDDWGRKVIAARLQKPHLLLTDILNHCGTCATLGALNITSADSAIPSWDIGMNISELGEITDSVWDGNLENLNHRKAELLMLLRGGSQAGGARPKLLSCEEVSGQNVPWLIKFNRSSDRFNYARMEYACLELCRTAGLPTPQIELMVLPSGREGLKIRRFDISPSGGRYHLASMNGLLKDPHTQDDPLYSSYEALTEIIRQYSWRPKEDLRTLFGQMLINMALRNTDDHLRNFSLMYTEKGWQLTPVYDIVPSEDLSTRHQLTCLRSDYLPNLNDAEIAGKKAFGLSSQESKQVIANIRAALSTWPDILEKAELSKSDSAFAMRLIKHVGTQD